MKKERSISTDELFGSRGEQYIFSQVVNCLEDELIVVDKDYRILFANSAMLKNHKKSTEETIGERCYFVSHNSVEPCHSPEHICPINLVFESGKPARVTHTHILKSAKKLTEKYIDVVASPVTDAQGNVIAVAELMRDVTEARELEMRLASTNRDLFALNTLISDITRSLNLDSILSSALEQTLEILNQDIGGILLIDAGSGMLSYRVHHGLSERYIQGINCRLGEGIAGGVAKTKESLLIEDISRSPYKAYNNIMNREGIRSYIFAPIYLQDRILGVINIASRNVHRLSSEELNVLKSITKAMAIAIENARLFQEVQLKGRVRGELLQEVFSTQEEERKRIARELHDETSQDLASLAANLEAAKHILPSGNEKIRAILKKAQELTINILDEVNRFIYELRPIVLDDLGLVAALNWLAENKLQAEGINLYFKTIGRESRLDSQLEVTIFRIVQEAISNIIKHAHAKNTMLILHFKKRSTVVRVEDDGLGFNLEEAISSECRPRGLGLLGIKERVGLLNGNFSITTNPGSGTQIIIEFPKCKGPK